MVFQRSALQKDVVGTVSDMVTDVRQSAFVSESHRIVDATRICGACVKCCLSLPCEWVLLTRLCSVAVGECEDGPEMGRIQPSQSELLICISA